MKNLIIFLAVILVLTLVARGTEAATLPKVDVTTTQTESITEMVSGSASVVSADTTDETAPAGLTVKELLVGVGQDVSVDDQIASFDTSGLSDELTRQNAQLQSQYLKLSQLTRTSSADYSAVDNANKTLTQAKNDYNAAKANAPSDADLQAAQDAVTAAQTAEQMAESNLSTAQAAEQSASDAVAAAENTNPVDDAAVQQAQQAEQQTAQALASAQQAVTDAQKAVTDAQGKLAAMQTAANAVAPASSKVDDAKSALNKAQSDYDKAAQQASDSNTQNSIDATTLQLDINTQEDLVSQLSALVNTGGILYSSTDGVVSSVMDTTKKTDGTSPVVQIASTAGGSKAEMTITSDDAELLAVGNECDIASGSGMYFRARAQATISAIAPPDDHDNVLVTLQLPDGSWTRGQKLDAQVIISQTNYDTCVPLSALHSDNSGYFVYTVTEKQTVLGTQNVVTRVPVNLQAEDDTYAAISGPVNGNDSIVTSSSKSIDDGSRVRVNQNA